jgi:hypothetical protein
VVDWGGAAVGNVQIGLGDAQVVGDHFHGLVTEHALQGPGIAAIAQKVDCEGMTKAVGMDVGYSGSSANDT